MKSIKDIMKKSPKETAKYCGDWLIAHGYIHNNIFGWEKIDIIEKFNLNPEMIGVPYTLQDKWVEVETTQKQTDQFGNVTGGKHKAVTWERSKTEKDWYPAKNWLDYIDFKKQRQAQYDKQDYARTVNTPPTIS